MGYLSYESIDEEFGFFLDFFFFFFYIRKKFDIISIIEYFFGICKGNIKFYFHLIRSPINDSIYIRDTLVETYYVG